MTCLPRSRAGSGAIAKCGAWVTGSSPRARKALTAKIGLTSYHFLVQRVFRQVGRGLTTDDVQREPGRPVSFRAFSAIPRTRKVGRALRQKLDGRSGTW